MIGGSRVLAIVPARGGSKGLPGKNACLLLGRPLVAWPVAAALGARCVDRVIVSTDDPDLAALARAAGAEVPFMRPAELAGDRSPTSDAVIHALDALEAAGDRFDYLVLLEPTSPLTESRDVDEALSRLHGSRAHADAIVGVVRTEAEHPAFAVALDSRGLAAPYAGGGFGSLPRRQDLPAAYRLDGSLYASKVPIFRESRSFCHSRTMGHIMPRLKAMEVDDLLDLVCIEAVAARLAELSPRTDG